MKKTIIIFGCILLFAGCQKPGDAIISLVENKEEENTVEEVAEDVTEVVKEEPEGSFDQEFLELMSQSLSARWDLAQNDENTEEISDEEYMKYMEDCVSVEKDILGDLRTKEFNDKKLQEYAISYMNALDEQEEGIKYYISDIEKYYDICMTAQDKRAEIIYKLYNDYDLRIDMRYANTCNHLFNRVKIRNMGGGKAVYDMIANQNIEWYKSTEKYDPNNTHFRFYITNTSQYDFEDLDVTLWLISEKNGGKTTFVDTEISKWKSGERVELNFTAENFKEKDFDSYDFTFEGILD